MENYMVGCNYWASNAGIYMWRRFDENVVDRDFALLKKYGLDTIRIFPLWSDFQPITNMFGLDKTFYVRKGDEPITTYAGLDEEMLSRFSKVLDLAEKYGFKVIVGLITGWMSGRLFYPELLYNENPLTSPRAIVWETRFITAFVSRFKDRKCIVAWEPGNECNCLAATLSDSAINAEQAELWLSSITHAIKASNNIRPIFAGMHGLGIENPWDLRTVAEYVDMQTTHPYPLFTPYCATESLTSMRAALHAAAESTYYADIAQQLCLVEEIGTLGPNVLSDDATPKYLEQSMFTSFQYGTTGYLWWCAFDQDQFEFSPYDGSAIERNLGLIKSNGTPKPVLKEMKKMQEVLSKIGTLPTFDKHAVVILSDGENAWKNAYGAFCLAAQAGYGVDFMYRSQKLKKSDFYIIPSVTADVYLKFFPELIERIKAGAKLLITYDGGHLARFEELTGLQVLGREQREREKSYVLDGKECSVHCKADLMLEAIGAKILVEENGNILLSENELGKGKVYFFNAPLENNYIDAYKPYETGLYQVYRLFLKGATRAFALENDQCCVTLHTIDENTVCVLIYNFSKQKRISYMLDTEYKISECMYCEIDGETLCMKEAYAYLRLKKA